MRKLVKFFVLLLSLFLIISCNKENNDEKKVLRVGMEVGYAPFNWYQSNDRNDAVKTKSGYANGYDVQMAKIIADKLGMDLEVVQLEWDALLGPALNSDEIDLVIAGVSPTSERKNSIDFTDSYYQSDLVIVVKKDSPFINAQSINDFKNAKITAQLNTIHYDVIDQLKDVDKQNAMDNFPTMLVALTSNKIDGYIAEKPSALSANFADPNISFVEFSENNGFNYDHSEVDVAIGVKKGNSELLEKVNNALSEIPKETREDLMKNAIKNQPLTDDEQNLAEFSFFDWVKYILQNHYKGFIKGTLITLYLSIVGTLAGFIIGLALALIRTKNTDNRHTPLKNIIFKVLQKLIDLYITIFRGTPMIVQAIILYYGISQVTGINLTPMIAALIIVSINTGAYISEIVRGGIISIDKGQYEASISLGLTHNKAMIYVILPQVIRNIIPAIGNEFIVNIKDTSVLFAIGVTEIYTMSRSIAGTYSRYYEVFIITSIIYFVLTFTLSKLLNRLEKYLDGSDTYEIEVK